MRKSQTLAKRLVYATLKNRVYHDEMHQVRGLITRASTGRIQGGPFRIITRPLTTSAPPGSLKPSIKNLLYGGLLAGCAWATFYANPWFKEHEEKLKEEEEHEDHPVSNWSNTHQANPKRVYYPDSIQEVERIVRLCHLTERKLRPAGSGLSPNGIGLGNEAMMNMALMDKLVKVDKEKQQATVQAGMRIEQVVEALEPFGLTLENFASINSQQVGGFTQVSAHGTGAAIPPVDERVVSLKLVTPNKGVMELSEESDPELFRLVRCGLGSLGVVAEVTLQCVPSHKLVEHTFATSMKDVRKNHKKWLRENKHLRYMWIPNTDTVVVVQCNPLPAGQEPPDTSDKYALSYRIKPMLELYKSKLATQSAGHREAGGVLNLHALSFAELRDKVLAFDPLNPDFVSKVNKAEEQYWKRSQGYRVGWSHEILGFDCGGQQWVSEVSFPAGTYDKPDLKDLKYMEDLLNMIKKNNIPAPSPIEQRWTSSSSSSMSPASDPLPERLFSWVGIIMYLPTDDDEQRGAITEKFFDYRKTAQNSLWDNYGAFEHWAKIELKDDEEAAWSSRRLQLRFPVDAFNRARLELDPKNILGNELIDRLFPDRITIIS